MKYFFLFLSLFIALVLETSILQLPLVFLLLLSILLIYQTEWIFFIAILSGFLLDGLLFRPIGETSIFFICFFFIVFLYKQKFEIQTIVFAILMSFIGSACYLLLFGSTSLLLQIVCSMLVGVCLFFFLSFFVRKPNTHLEFAT